jgi:hypothetical protein
MNTEDARKNFLEINEILNRCKIKFYLAEGTLLGAIRNRSFVPWDRDLDFFVMAADWKSLMRHKFKENGFKYKDAKCPELYQDKSSGCRMRKRGIDMDISLNYYYPPEDCYLTLSHRPHSCNTYRPARFFQGNHFIDFFGVKVRILHPPEEYLQILFGKEWKIPREDKYYSSGQKPVSMEKYIKYFHEHPEIN